MALNANRNFFYIREQLNDEDTVRIKGVQYYVFLQDIAAETYSRLLTPLYNLIQK